MNIYMDIFFMYFMKYVLNIVKKLQLRKKYKFFVIQILAIIKKIIKKNNKF